MSENEHIDVGSPAPDFALPALDNTTVKLSGFKGKNNVIVYFMRAFT